MIIEQISTVDAPVEQVWERIVSAEGINDEMRPWMTMSFPRAAESMTIDTVPVGEPLGRAWLRLFGVVPFEYDFLTIAELDSGRRFHEKSTMLTMRRWEHERSLAPAEGGGTTVHDRVTFQTRRPLEVLSPLISRVLRAFFGHRHRRLQKHFS